MRESANAVLDKPTVALESCANRWGSMMASEKQWVASLVARLDSAVQAVSVDGSRATVEQGKRLPYRHEVLDYSGNDPDTTKPSSYETDLLAFDRQNDDSWVPRVVIECKLGSVTTHDAITYSTKAATHKNVHPYLRYGILIGNWGDHAFPVRLFRHGDHFDFMATWAGEKPTNEEWYALVRVLNDEIKSSRRVHEMLASHHFSSKPGHTLVHRPLVFQ